MPDIANGLVFYAVFLFSTTLHEAAHAWAAMKGGDLTAYHGGQVSLDPMPHIRREPFGMVILPLLSVLVAGWPFGYASAPYNPHWALRHPNRAAVMSLAGPGANLLLVLVFGGLIRLGSMAGIFTAPSSVRFGQVVEAVGGGLAGGAAVLVSVFFSLNLLLAVFNMLPLPPLDGSAAIPLLLHGRAATRYMEFLLGNPGLAFFGILVAWKIFDPIFQPVWLFAVNLLYPGTRYG